MPCASSRPDCYAGETCALSKAIPKCVSGNCDTSASCATGQICVANQCLNCVINADCTAILGPGNVCSPAGLCESGQCARNSDCPTGQACIGLTCQGCGTDSQCSPGFICVGTACTFGNCHDNVVCGSTAQICVNHSCAACTVGGANSGGCGTNNVCDAGKCASGNCVQNQDCGGGSWNGNLCISHSCVTCNSANSALCGAGYVCVGGACTAGACASNTDCSSTQVCNTSSHLCVGNCRANTDCPATGYCGANNLCASCTNSGQCGSPVSGQLCETGVCMTGQCATDSPCASGKSCNAQHQCVQVAPTLGTPGPAVPGSSSPIINSSPQLMQGKSGYFYSAGTNTGGTVAGLLDASYSPVWSVKDSTYNSSLPTPGMVVPAPGLPGGEIYVSSNGLGNMVAHSALNGSVLWDLNGFGFNGGSANYDIAAGLANGLPVVYGITNPFFVQVRTDGTNVKTFTNPSCGYLSGPAVGSKLVYLVCPNALVGVNPSDLSLAFTLSFTAFNSSFTGSMSAASAMAISRPAGQTADLIYFVANYAGNSYFFAAKELDSEATLGHAPTVIYPPLPLNASAVGGGNPKGLVLLDESGNAYVSSGGTLTEVSPAGVISAQVTTPFAVNAGNGNNSNTFFALLNDPAASGPSIVSIDSSANLVDILLTGSNSYVTQWTLPFSGGGWAAMWPGVLANGALDLWAGPASGASSTVQILSPLNSASFYLPPPAWQMRGGDSGGHEAVSQNPPSCAADTDCAATQICFLGQCAGFCRSATDCPGQACSGGACNACQTDASCGAGNVCFNHQCDPCSGTGGAVCCHTSTDCSSATTCIRGVCSPNPTLAQPDKTSYLDQRRPGVKSVGTDGIIYSTTTESGTDLEIQALDPTNGNTLWKLDNVNSWGSQSNANYGAPLITRLGSDTHDTLFFASDQSNNLLAIAGGVTQPALNYVALPGASNVSSAGAIALGTSSGGPAIFGVTIPGPSQIFAMDALLARAGTQKVLWKANVGNTNWNNINGNSCASLDGVITGNLIFVGSDGTVYHLCTGGQLQAWEPNGDPQAVGLGKIRWQALGDAPQFYGVRAAMTHVSGADILYSLEYHSPGPISLAVWTLPTPAATAPAAPKSVSVNCGDISNDSVVTDNKGNAVVVCNTSVTVVSPAGVVLSNVAVPSSLGRAGGVGISDDNVLYYESSTLNGLQIDSMGILSPVWSTLAPGQLSFGNDVLLLTRVGGMPRIFIDPILGGPKRDLLIYALPTGTGPAPSNGAIPIWSSWGGDNQRRFSLEAMAAGPTGY